MNIHEQSVFMNIHESFIRRRSQPSTAVKENGVTTSHVTPHTQAPPISTPPLLLAPPTSTPSPSPIVPPSPQTNSTISDSETTPPAPPTSSASPGNNQTSLSDVIAAVKDVGDKINEGEAPEISGEGSSEPQHTSLGPSLVGEVCVCVYGRQFLCMCMFICSYSVCVRVLVGVLVSAGRRCGGRRGEPTASIPPVPHQWRGRDRGQGLQLNPRAC